MEQQTDKIAKHFTISSGDSITVHATITRAGNA